MGSNPPSYESADPADFQDHDVTGNTAQRQSIAVQHQEAMPNAREVREKMLAVSRERSTVKGLAIFLPLGILYLLTLTAIIAVPFWPLRLLLAALNGLVLSILFVVGHDACHGAFTPSRRLNNVLGRLAFLPAGHPYAGWDHAHNRVHHSWANLRGKDYAWAPLTKAEYDRCSLMRRWLERFYRSPWGFGAYYFIEIYWKRMLFPSRAFWGNGSKLVFHFDRLLVLLFLVVQGAYLIGLTSLLAAPISPWAALAYGQWLPFLSWNWLIGFLIFHHHTHPRAPWFDDRDQWSFYGGQVQGSVHLVFPWGINTLIQHIMEHTAHHADPKIPLYNLDAAQRRLEQAYPIDVIVQPFTFGSLRHTLRVCQLYDFEHHRWVSFSGEATSGPTIWPLPNARARAES